ncbi:hypothetical protein [Nesterenkonia pannonica]|uniref:hypothetical protein n=1 Tax=Nesterenkonia pannonica TaxID=1548602 RepID=UPI002164393F|nr:hypothetical protein [Nesterenkonia pannonica]
MRADFKAIVGFTAVGMLALSGCSAGADAEGSADGGGEGEELKVAAFTAGYGTPAGKLTLDHFVDEGEERGWDVTLHQRLRLRQDQLRHPVRHHPGADVILAGFPTPTDRPAGHSS